MISKEDYWKLIESAQEDDDDMMGMSYSEEAWIPAVSPAKEKMDAARAASAHGMVDVLKYRKEAVQEAIYKCMNLQVGEFIIHIKRYNGHPKDKQFVGPLTLDINVMQERYQTPSGAPCKMSYKFDFFRDNRFTNRPWLSYFDSSGNAEEVPVETLVEIIRWMQALRRMNAFL